MLKKWKCVAGVIAAIAASSLAAGSALANTQVDAWGPLHASSDYQGTLQTIVDENWYVFYSPSVQQLVFKFIHDGRDGQSMHMGVATSGRVAFGSRV